MTRINALFMLFIGWTVSIGGLFITLFFLAFSLSGPTFHPPESRIFDIESVNELHRAPSSDFAPSSAPSTVSIQLPQLARHRSHRVPPPSSNDWESLDGRAATGTKSQRWVPSEWATARQALEDDEAETEDLQRRRGA